MAECIKVGCITENKKENLCEFCVKNINIWDDLSSIHYWKIFTIIKNLKTKPTSYSCNGYEDKIIDKVAV